MEFSFAHGNGETSVCLAVVFVILNYIHIKILKNCLKGKNLLLFG